jgi:dTDP-4-amino-4,6-dideoxygalactose transaminase
MSFNPYKVVDEFEKMIAEWSGSKYAVAVESCTAALFLCCKWMGVGTVSIPKHTYPSVPCSIIHAGGKVKFKDEDWSGVYELYPYKIYDGALRFREGMYKGGLHCLSFHNKKLLPIGRGGMILTNSALAYEWFKRARFDGRREVPLEDDTFDMLGWNMYMTPEQAIKGIQLFSTIDQRGQEDLLTSKQEYPDLSKYAIYKTSK